MRLLISKGDPFEFNMSARLNVFETTFGAKSHIDENGLIFESESVFKPWDGKVGEIFAFNLNITIP